MSNKNRTYCAVHQCASQRYIENLSFFRLPHDEERRRLWCNLIGRPELAGTNSNSHVVCGLHFQKSDLNNRPLLKPDAIPSLLLPNQPDTSSSTNSDSSTQTDISYVQMRSTTTIEHADIESQSVQTSTYCDKNEVTQTGLGLFSSSLRKRKLMEEIKELTNENRKLKLELEKIKEKNTE